MTRISLFILCLLISAIVCVESRRHSGQRHRRTRIKTGSRASGKVVGGVRARATDFPHQLYLEARNDGPMCSASIIGKYYALTAAHCLFAQNNIEMPPEDFILYAGLTNKNVRGAYNRTVESYVIHPLFNIGGGGPPNPAGDIALLKVSKPFTTTSTTKKIRLPQQDEKLQGKTATLAGWGFVDQSGIPSDILMKTTLYVRPDSDCLRNPYYIFNPEIMLCGGSPTNSCQGDSGGALIQGQKQIGIVSVNSGRCVLNAPPSIFTKVSAFRDWIDDNVEMDKFQRRSGMTFVPATYYDEK